jgi:hypothetical protein
VLGLFERASKLPRSQLVTRTKKQPMKWELMMQHTVDSSSKHGEFDVVIIDDQEAPPPELPMVTIQANGY